MAVMTTQLPEGVTLEQKTQPVPSSSSDEMALDLEINGTSHRDGTSGDVAPNATDAFLPKPVSSSAPSNEPFSSGLAAVNGAPNNVAFASNASIPTTPLEQFQHESQPADPSLSAAESSPQLPDTNTTATTEEEHLSIAQPASQVLDASAGLSSTDAAIVAAVEDMTVTSTVPPIVESQESDIRGSTPALQTESVIEPASTPILPIEPADQSSALDFSTSADPLSSEQIEVSLGPEQSSAFEAASVQLPSSDPALDFNLQSEQELDPSLGATIAVSQDINMMDAPQLPISSKVSREREDDEDAERSAKRTKTEGNSLAEVNSTNGIEATTNHSGESSGVQAEAGPQDERSMTQFAVKEVTKHVKNAARTADGKHFKDSVGVLWPAFAESYAAKIQNAIDLAAIERKLKAGSYPTLKDVKNDIALLRNNAITFNGADNAIAQSAVRAAKALIDKIEAIPADPVAAPKKEKKSKASTPVGETIPKPPTVRRQSRGGANPSTDVAPTQTFALDPQSNTPLIRRDSTKGDGGRPKREIHPPKNKDLTYSVRPKSKKYATELRWCDEVLSEIKKAKYGEFTYPFMQPVDPVAQGIPTYFNVIKNPMDISTLSYHLSSGQYVTSRDFEKDMNLIIANCFKFNPVGNPVHELGKRFEAVWKEQLAKKARWIADHAPLAASVSPTPDSDPEESDDDTAVPAQAAPVSNVRTEATKRLVEEQQKLIALMSNPSTSQGLINMQKAMVKVVEDQIEQENEAAAAAAQASKKTKKGKAAKPAAPLARRKSTSNKKSSGSGNKSGARKQERYMGTLEKEVISAGIATLPEHISAHVLKLIQDGQPDVETEDDGTLELDIDAVPTTTLWKIYDLIKTHTPDVERDLRRQFQERDAPRAAPKPAPKKKNRPMNKYEQDRKIEQLKNQVETFERRASVSQEPIPTVESNNQDDSSGDEDSDSEEE